MMKRTGRGDSIDCDDGMCDDRVFDGMWTTTDRSYSEAKSGV